MTHVNLMSPTSLSKTEIWRIIKLWLLFALAVLAAWGAWTIVQYLAANWSQETLRVLRRQYDRHHDAGSKIKLATNRLTQLQESEKEIFAIADDIPVDIVLGIVSHAAEQSGGDVYVEQLRLELGADATRGNRNAAGNRHRLVLQGVAVDNLSIARFAAAIRDSGVFEQVDLESTASVIKADSISQQRSFRIHCVMYRAQVEETIP